MEKICQNCLESFSAQTERLYCSRSCANKARIGALTEKLCAVPSCENFFKPTSLSAIYCSKYHDKPCEACGKDFRTLSRNHRKNHYCPRCSRKRAAEKSRETNLKLYGVENAMQREEVKEASRRTSQDRYGKDHYTQTDEYREKVVATNQRLYGVDHTFQRKEVIEKAVESRRPGTKAANQKRLETTKKLYGVENVGQLEETKAKIRATTLERFGGPSVFSDPSISSKREATWKKNWGGHPFNHPEIRALREEALQNSSSSRISKLNRDFRKFLQEELEVEVELEKPLGRGYADLYVPRAELYIELNPAVSHNSDIAYTCILKGCGRCCASHKPFPKDRHQERAIAAMEEGKSLIQIYDWSTGVEAMLRKRILKDGPAGTVRVEGTGRGEFELYPDALATEEDVLQCFKSLPVPRAVAVNFSLDLETSVLEALGKEGFRDVSVSEPREHRWALKDSFLSKSLGSVLRGSGRTPSPDEATLGVWDSGVRMLEWTASADI